METYGTGNGLLPCYSPDMLQDWEKQFNKNNYLFGLPLSANPKLLPFNTPNILTAFKSLLECNRFVLQRVSISGAVKTVISETELDTSLMNKITGTLYCKFVFTAQNNIGLFDSGIYQMVVQVTDRSSVKVFTTELFKIEGCNQQTDSGDYLIEDYNNDYYV